MQPLPGLPHDWHVPQYTGGGAVTVLSNTGNSEIFSGKKFGLLKSRISDPLRISAFELVLVFRGMPPLWPARAGAP